MTVSKIANHSKGTSVLFILNILPKFIKITGGIAQYISIDYSGLIVPSVAVCNVPQTALSNVPPQKWLH